MAAKSNSDNKRLAKNTLLLYFRTLVMMFIGFYTSRVIINALGIENYGIKNVVGGFIAMFSIVSGTLTATTQRYITVEIGKGENGNPTKMFGVAMGIHVILAFVLFVLFETIGNYFLNNGLNIPSDRMYAANWVFQLAVISTILGILNAPYIGVLIAHERMSAFAYFSMFDVIAKLLICYLLYITPFDRLITYSLFFTLIVLINLIIYNYYCRKNFSETKISFIHDRKLYKEMFVFSGMNFIGAFASLMSIQGTNLLLNIFYGVTLNAAKGIATQVQSITTKFVGDFMMALKPQITKEYASGNILRSMELAFRGSKLSYFLTLIIACPILVRTPYILEFWLRIYPEYTIIFSRLTIFFTMLVLLSDSLVTVILATGNLTYTTWCIGGTRLLILPMAYMALVMTDLPYIVLIVQITIEILSLFIRLIILNKITAVNFFVPFFKTVLVPIILVTTLSFTISCGLDYMFPQNFIGLCFFSIFSVCITALVILYWGLSEYERKKTVQIIRNKIKQFII